MPGPIEALQAEIVYRGAVFDVAEEHLRLATGSRVRHVTVRHPGAVVIVPRQADGRLLLIEQYRHSLRQNLLEFPAGTLETGESPLGCAQRELAEETGQAARQWEGLGELHPAPGFCNEIQHCFYAADLSPCEAVRDEDEWIELRPMTDRQVEQAIQTGAITDGKSIALYLRAKLRGFI